MSEIYGGPTRYEFLQLFFYGKLPNREPVTLADPKGEYLVAVPDPRPHFQFIPDAPDPDGTRDGRMAITVEFRELTIHNPGLPLMISFTARAVAYARGSGKLKLIKGFYFPDQQHGEITSMADLTELEPGSVTTEPQPQPKRAVLRS